MPNRHAGVRGVLVLILAAVGFAAPPADPARADECPDALITAGVKTRLAADNPAGVLKINVDTEECVVTLNGCVESKDHANRAKKLAGKVAKVKAVKSNLTICPEKD